MMPYHVAPQHIGNRALRRWYNRHGPVSRNLPNQWHVEEFGPSQRGWYWDFILSGKPLTEIVIRPDGKVRLR